MLMLLLKLAVPLVTAAPVHIHQQPI